MSRILLVEDEAALAEPLRYLLENEGYTVALARDGEDALAQFGREGADVVLLDLMLPGLSGKDVCRRIRSHSRVPIIMLTAKDSETDIVVGLELGADDYVTKPYSSRELIARVGAVLRRFAPADGPTEASGDADAELLSAGPVELDAARHTVTVAGQPLKLPRKEFALLQVLLENAGRVLTRGQLIDRVWGQDYVGDTKTLDVHVRRLRSRIETDPSRPAILVTVRGVGYRLEA